MAFLASRYFARCHRMMKAGHGKGIFSPQTRVSLSLLNNNQRHVLPALSLTALSSTTEGPVKRNILQTALSRVSPMNISATSYRYMLRNGPQRFTTSTPLQTSGQSNNDGPLIYQGGLNNILKYLKILSLSSSAFGCVLVPVIVYNNNSIIGMIFASFASLTIFTPLLLHWFTKGYVSHIHFNRERDTYTALTYTLFLRAKRLQFTPDDVEVPAMRNIFTSFTAKGVPLLVDDSRFANQNDVMHLKGYDKKLADLSFEDLKKLYEKEEGIQKQ